MLSILDGLSARMNNADYGTTNADYRTTNADAGVEIGMKRGDSEI